MLYWLSMYSWSGTTFWETLSLTRTSFGFTLLQISSVSLFIFCSIRCQSVGFTCLNAKIIPIIWIRSCCVGAWRDLSVWTSQVVGSITSWPKEKFIACSAAIIAQSSLATCPHRAAGAVSFAVSRPFWRLIPIFVLPQTFHTMLAR